MVKFETRAGKWLAAALTASLAINVFLGGLFVGRWMGPSPVLADRGPPRAERPVQAMLDRMAGTLEAEERTTFDRVMEKHRPRLTSTGAEFRDARRRTVELMTAEPFDATKLDAAMAALRDRNLEFQRALHTALIDAAASLPPAARHKMAAAGRPRSERERPPGG